MTTYIDYIGNFLTGFFCNPRATPMYQLITAFVFGVLLSPWSEGIFLLILVIIFWELGRYIWTVKHPQYFDPFVRIGVVSASIMGWIIGRTVSHDVVMSEGVSEFPSLINW